MIVSQWYWWIVRQVDVPRPARTINPAAKLKDTANTEAPQLSFQRKAVQDFHSRQANKNDPPPASSTPDANPHAPSSVNMGLASQNKHSNSPINDSDTEDEIIDQPVPCMSCLGPMITFSSASTSFTAKKKCATATMCKTVDDVDMMDAEENIHAKGMIFPIAKGHQRKLKCLLI